LRAYLRGETKQGDFGIPYQLRVFADHGLKATFFIDPLFSFAIGVEPLRALVLQVNKSQQEIGLHLHPEWLTDPRCTGLPAFAGPLLSDYDRAAQQRLIGSGVDRLVEAGAGPIEGFRAGSWGANTITLEALRACGLRFDSSLNAAFGHSLPDLEGRSRYQRPVDCGAIKIFPVTHFVDGSRRGVRPLHVTACSFDEFRHVLDASVEQQRAIVVIVVHSFEFVRVGSMSRGRLTEPQRLLIRRFEKICGYLNEHKAVLRSSHFHEIRGESFDGDEFVEPIQSSRQRTIARIAQQLMSRVY